MGPPPAVMGAGLLPCGLACLRIYTLLGFGGASEGFGGVWWALRGADFAGDL